LHTFISVSKENPEVTRKLRLIGLPYNFLEYSARKRNPDDPTKPFDVPFPDAEDNKNYTRIGHDDPDQCPWRRLGYLAAKKSAVRVLEEQPDKTWKPKILCKGPTIFNEFAKWQANRELANEDKEDGETDLNVFLGGDKAPIVQIKATRNTDKPGGVEYFVAINPKESALTEAMIASLKSSYEPKADKLNALRAEYEEARENDPSMPEWRDYFEYGFDIDNIFKHTPLIEKLNDSSDTDSPELDLSEPSEETEGSESTELDLGDVW